jgi:hypothetical protein
MFNTLEMNKLKAVGRNPRHPDFGMKNPALDTVIDQLKRSNPFEFLKPQDLEERKFFNQPKNLHFRDYRSYVKIAPHDDFKENK